MGFYADLTGRQMLQFVAELNGIRVRLRIRKSQSSRGGGLADETAKKIAAYSRACASGWGLRSCSSRTAGWRSWTSRPWVGPGRHPAHHEH